MTDEIATSTTTAKLDVRAMREGLIENEAEKRGIAIGLCLAAAFMVRDEGYPRYARDILEMDALDASRIQELVDRDALDEYDAEPLLAMLAEQGDFY